MPPSKADIIRREQFWRLAPSNIASDNRAGDYSVRWTN